MTEHLEEIKQRVLEQNGWGLKKRLPKNPPQSCPYYVERKPNAFCKAIPGEIAAPGRPKSWQDGTLGRINTSADSLILHHCKFHFLDCGWYEKALFMRTITKKAKQFIEEVTDICLREIHGFGLRGEDFFVEKDLKKELTYDYEIVEKEEGFENAEKDEDLSYLRRWPSHRVRFERVVGPSR
jgi:hypothetical protein